MDVRLMKEKSFFPLPIKNHIAPFIVIKVAIIDSQIIRIQPIIIIKRHERNKERGTKTGSF